MKVLMGIGNDLRGDDAIGIYIAKNFKKEGWKVIIAGQVPEDFTGEIKRIKPDLLILVDAALMGLQPGEFRVVPTDLIPNVAFSTHGMPLSFFINYIGESAQKIILIGIEPKNLEFGEELSPEVKEAGDKIIEILKKEEIEEIKILKG
ncbi:hydrogenase maturation peptidase HycI [Candidatus Aciduliprofundum boonei]|uniref:Hydrogenase maturation protease n=1 Tax=Aciduliprofundum boonei (strain DSM 19572 / T469) TaxID=439481 RepID=B5I9M2_ACIB4|nr:hydrogenase maturation peptidase HycI [Candidatus Aciduliprofundum boonei]ADD08505.1 hydrogenase maturation protease [Aciduliprofundum boonei T469]EDY37100.1 hydrogenase maturation peptidase HycI [Aciduliprofundum boonei T469]HII54923.1 hydrogenase maturation peptidase HycI [Candidatus Aciduliprofundum boonei]